MKKLIIALAFCGYSQLAGFTTPPNWSKAPWIPDTLEIQPSLKGAWQSCGVSTVQGAVGTAFEPFAAEVGVDAFHSRKTSFAFEDAFLIGRYQWMDQDVGDPYFVTLGAQLSFVSHLAYKEKNLFHFGNFETELFGSLGSESYCSEFAVDWISRWWVTGGVGIANRRSPWFLGNCAYEYAFCPSQRVRAFADAIIGIGRMQKGIDLGVAATYETFEYGCLDFSYAFRVYSRHVCRNVSTLTLCYYYPFGI